MQLREQEEKLIDILREWGGNDECSLTIAFRDGAWETSISTVVKGKKISTRGVGRTFGEAWDSEKPTGDRDR